MHDIGPFHSLSDFLLVASGVHETVFVDDAHEEREVELIQPVDVIGVLSDGQNTDVVAAFSELFREPLGGNARCPQ